MRFRHLEHQDDVAYSHYGYDSNSNRNSGFYAGVASVTAAYDAQDRMSSYNSKTYTYNANGEIQGSVGSGVTSSYSFDALGSLKGVTIGSTAITYKLDGLGRRSAKYVNGTLQTRFLYEDGLRIGTTLTSTRTLASRFVYGAKGNVPDYMVVGTTTYKIVSDERGSPLLVVNASTGAIAEQITYDEFGNVLSDTAPGFQPFGFAGCLYDQDTKLCQFGARSYDPSTGRWLSKDPLLFGGGDTNLYGYSMNDPINFVDPTGDICMVATTTSNFLAVGTLTAQNIGLLATIAYNNATKKECDADSANDSLINQYQQNLNTIKSLSGYPNFFDTAAGRCGLIRQAGQHQIGPGT